GVGSTGRIAADLCCEHLANGNECIVAYGRECKNSDDIATKRIGTPLDYKLHGIETRLFDRHGFGSKAATKKFLQWVKEYNPDLIHLHNIHGYYINIEMLFDYIKQNHKKVLWTLHDCWAFTGHCTYFDFVCCDKWKTGCAQCPQKGEYPKSYLADNSRQNYERKKAAFTGVEDLTIITPSKWLADLVHQSFLKEYPTKVVYNTIDTSVFKPTHSDFKEKQRLQNKKIILGVANIWDRRKGLQDFIKLSEMLDENYQIVLVGLSEKQMNAIPSNILGITRTDSAKQLAEIYTAADVFVNPSVEETFGLTSIEALACGTFVIVYQDTACEEIVGSDNAVKKGDTAAIKHKIETLVKQ
ncbi:MAG: glycosyltransferase, partial [Ruthenibacterium sp.]